MNSFFEFEAQKALKDVQSPILHLNDLIDWQKLSLKIGNLYKSQECDLGGNRHYDSLKMFKAILLGQWHNLSDPKLSQSLSVRLDFMLFTGFNPSDGIPDDTTLCRFRNRLVKANRLSSLLEEVNAQLEERNLKVKASEGAVLDASVIQSAARPRKVIEQIPEDRNEPDSDTETFVEYSVDKEANFLIKGKKVFYGYKLFMSVDQEDGYIESGHITPASNSEIKQFKEAIEHLPNKNDRWYFADKGFASKENREALKDFNMHDGIMNKAVRNRPLSSFEKRVNKWISSYRFIVEQGFGTLKRIFEFSRASYYGIEKTTGQFHLKAICFNLLKAFNKTLA